MRHMMPVRLALDGIVQIARRQRPEDGLAGTPFPFRIGVFLKDCLLELAFQSFVLRSDDSSPGISPRHYCIDRSGFTRLYQGSREKYRRSGPLCARRDRTAGILRYATFRTWPGTRRHRIRGASLAPYANFIDPHSIQLVHQPVYRVLRFQRAPYRLAREETPQSR